MGEGRVVETCGVLPIDADDAFIRAIQAADDVEQRGLSRAGLADQGHQLPLFDVEGDAAQHFLARAAAPIRFSDAGEANDRVGHEGALLYLTVPRRASDDM